MNTSKAAAAMGRKGGKATGPAKVRGDSDHYRAIRAKRRPRQAYTQDGEWSGYTVREGLRGWIVETWSRVTGTSDGQRLLVVYTPEVPRSLRLDAPINECSIGADLVREISRQAEGVRVLRRGHIIR